MFEGDKIWSLFPISILKLMLMCDDKGMKKFNNTRIDTRLMIKPTNSVWDGGTQSNRW